MKNINFILSIIISISLIIACGTNKKGENKTSSDTITKDWYSASTILDYTKPQEKKYKYPDGKTPKENGKSNEQITRIMYISEPSYKEMKEVYLFYKEFYRKRAYQLDNQVTLYVTFYNQRISKKDADPDNDNYDIKIDDYMCGNFIFNYSNEYYFEGNFK